MQKSYKCLLFRKRLKSLIDLQSFNSVSNEFQRLTAGASLLGVCVCVCGGGGGTHPQNF